MHVDVVLLAAGSGTRMGGLDKSLINVAGRPLLRWSLDVLEAHPAVRRVILVTASDRVASLSANASITSKVTQIVPGGTTRAASVAAGLTALRLAPGPTANIAAVHDVARPGISAALLDRLFAACGDASSAPVLPLADSITQVHGQGSRRVAAGVVQRETLAAAQTPQCFAGQHLSAMIGALHADAASPTSPTDEIGYLERLGVTTHLVTGDLRLHKLTAPADLPYLELLLAGHTSAQPAGLIAVAAALGATANLSALRVGWGDDVHPVGAAGELRLGGLTFIGSPALTGHSDGDVVLHAAADALLGAASLGDLGRHFPATSETPRGADSATLLRQVVARAAEAGLAPRWVDLTITARSPRLADRLPEMANRIGALLGLQPTAVNVKASTGNLVGEEGAGRAVRCTVILLAERQGG